MKVLVMGSGGVGGYYGGLLAKSGHNVTFIARGEHYQSLKNNGLTIESQDTDPFTLRVNVTQFPNQNESYDLILFAVKTYDTFEAIKSIESSVTEETVILTFQNGFESGQEIKSLLRQGTLLEGPAYTVCSIKKPGVIQQIGNVNKLIMGPLLREDFHKAELLINHLSGSGWPIELTESPQRELWSKLVFLGPLAAITSITDLNAGEIRSNEFTLKIMEKMMREYAKIGNATGANLNSNVVGSSMKTLHLYPSNGSTSMARDKKMGKKMEIEALLGSVIKKGNEHSIDIPITTLIYGLLNPSVH